jgi:hypothetical protein
MTTVPSSIDLTEKLPPLETKQDDGIKNVKKMIVVRGGYMKGYKAGIAAQMALRDRIAASAPLPALFGFRSARQRPYRCKTSYFVNAGCLLIGGALVWATGVVMGANAALRDMPKQH